MKPSTRNKLIAGAFGVGVLVVLAVIAPEIYSGTFSDVATFSRVMLVVAALVAFSVAVRRWVGNEIVAATMIAVPVVIVLGLYVWPYVRPATEVDEAFPPTAGAPTPDDGLETTVVAPSTAAPSTGSPATALDPVAPTVVATVTASSTQDTAGEDDVGDAATVGTTASTTTTTPQPTTTTIQPTTTTTTTQPTTTSTTVPAGPVELRRSTFQGLAGHRGSGDAAVYRLEDGSILLRFEEVDIGSGPVLAVYLVPGADRRGVGDGIYVAALTAERGNQNYTVPAGVDLTTGTWTVLVWCETFVVEVANATLG